LKIFALLFLLVAAQVQAATTYYVSPAGKDSTCTVARTASTPAGPKLQFVMGCMIGGDTLLARGGIYEEPLHKAGLNGMFPRGVAGAPTLFKPFPGEKVWLRTVPTDPWSAIFEFDSHAYITFDGISFDGFVDPSRIPFTFEFVMVKIQAASHHIRIINGEVKNMPDGWWSSANGDDNEVSGMVMHDYFAASSYLSGGTGCAQAVCWGYPFYWNGLRNKITNNHVYNVPSWVVHLYCYAGYCTAPTETLVQDNNIHDFGSGDPTRANGILVYNGNANRVINNAVWNNKGSAPSIAVGTAATSTILSGNTNVPPGVSVPPNPEQPPPAATNFIDVRTDRNVTVTGNSVSISKDKSTKIVVNGVPR
jgi:hypothetical protein